MIVVTVLSIEERVAAGYQICWGCAELISTTAGHTCRTRRAVS